MRVWGLFLAVAFLAFVTIPAAFPEPRSGANLEAVNDRVIALYQATKYDEAVTLARRNSNDAKARYGENSAVYLVTLNNLAQLLQATNQLAEAEALYRRALAIDTKSLGPDHPNVGRDLNNMAQLLQDMNRPADAEPLMRLAIATFEKGFGPNHPNVAKAVNNLAQLLEATGRLAEAEPLLRQTLAIDEKSLGADHPDVATDLNNLAALLQATNRLAEAELLIRRALAIHEKTLAPIT
ncbi:MAG: tetratricopeptide repeat protein [Rhodomicrobium sp.]